MPGHRSVGGSVTTRMIVCNIAGGKNLDQALANFS